MTDSGVLVMRAVRKHFIEAQLPDAQLRLVAVPGETGGDENHRGHAPKGKNNQPFLHAPSTHGGCLRVPSAGFRKK
jgi:hypothetical protein